MATLIIELRSRHGSQFHKINKPTVRVGRALDNDIILTDPTVSPYHFLIQRDANNEYQLRSLADENGIRIGRRKISETVHLNELPLDFEAGRTHVRLSRIDQAVAPTRLISCAGTGTCLFDKAAWALLLFLGAATISLLDNYLSTTEVIGWESFWRDQIFAIMVIIGLYLVLVLTNRLISHRWEFISALSFVSLVLITAFVLDEIILLANYYFTSALPGFAIALAWSFLVLPVALAWFLVKFHHGNTATSILAILLFFTPGAYFQVKEIIAHYGWFDDFSKTAYYSDTLSPSDYRLQQSLSIEAFSQTIREKLDIKPTSE
jgi:hypothetical protein